MQKLVLLFVLVAASLTQPKTFTRCGLVEELSRQGFPEDNLADWVCLVEAESGRRTDRVGKVFRDGSRDHGLFAINDLYWCSKTNKPGGDCHVTCSQVMTDDIKKASKCAQKIFEVHQSFDFWYGWRKHCQGRPLPNITNCSFSSLSKAKRKKKRKVIRYTTMY